MKKSTKKVTGTSLKLILHHETVRQLSALGLKAVVGGNSDPDQCSTIKSKTCAPV
jgi:hypothetical protein